MQIRCLWVISTIHTNELCLFVYTRIWQLTLFIRCAHIEPHTQRRADWCSTVSVLYRGCAYERLTALFDINYHRLVFIWPFPLISFIRCAIRNENIDQQYIFQCTNQCGWMDQCQFNERPSAARAYFVTITNDSLRINTELSPEPMLQINDRQRWTEYSSCS